jgi:hypothetical protein
MASTLDLRLPKNKEKKNMNAIHKVVLHILLSVHKRSISTVMFWDEPNTNVATFYSVGYCRHYIAHS